MPRSPETTREMLQILSVQPKKIKSALFSLHYFTRPFPFLPIPSRQHPPTSSNLLTLPFELLTTILLALDFDTLGCLRLTCLTLNLAISNLKEFQLLTRHAFAVLRALRITDFVSYHSIAKIYIGLITPKCFLCGDFGPYFSVFHGERVCYPCVFAHPSLRLLFRSVAERYLGIPHTNTSLRELPLYPGGPSLDLLKSQALVSFEEAKEETVRLHGSEQAMHDFVFAVQTRDFETCSAPRNHRPIVTKEFWYQDDDLHDRIVDQPVLGDLQWMDDFPRAFAFRGVMGFPWLDEGRSETQDGLLCKECYQANRDHRLLSQMNLQRTLEREQTIVGRKVSHRAWTEEELVVHTEACGSAENIRIKLQRYRDDLSDKHPGTEKRPRNAQPRA